VIAVLCVATLGLGWWEGRRHGERADGPAVPVVRVAARDGRALVEEAIRLYAAGQFPRACERLSRTADGDPSSASRRAAVGSCFEGWGWQALTEGRPDEATLLFRQGLAETPEAPALLKGLGLAAVHAGRPEEALGPLSAPRAKRSLTPTSAFCSRTSTTGATTPTARSRICARCSRATRATTGRAGCSTRWSASGAPRPAFSARSRRASW
jgi:hypothetical protein